MYKLAGAIVISVGVFLIDSFLWHGAWEIGMASTFVYIALTQKH